MKNELAKFPLSPTGSKGTVSSNISGFAKKSASNSNIRLPAELLILNRYGIGYPYLKAAWKISQRYQIPPCEILIKSKIITLETWLHAQMHLALERKRVIANRRREELLLNQSINNLKDTLPQYSARKTFSPWQILFAGICLSWFLVLFYLDYQAAIFSIIAILTLFYLAGIILRGLLLASFQPAASPGKEILGSKDEELPIYTILVALYREAGQVPALTQSLWHLDWPRHKLDIKLICEADDHETIAAILDAKLPSCFELIQVPYAQPRTKPKALNYALPLCRGEFLVLYDAEDIPSPGQLREAYQTFMQGSDKLACLQAPLHIHNQKQNWLTAMFAIEYVTLFNGILPVLAKWQAMIPLGGTSNHFRTKILKEIGAWDPYNVTEDADLGIRLFREGYRCSTITLPTYEEAPPELWPWIKQRTRWLKGWMQTILVHSRNPLHFMADTGLKNAVTFHLIMTSIVISVLVHPFFLMLSLWQILNLGTLSSGFDGLLIATSVFNLVGGYTTYGLLAYAVLQNSHYFKFSGLLLTLPAYWLLISIAGWRALVHLIVKPHEWEKTPHGLAK